MKFDDLPTPARNVIIEYALDEIGDILNKFSEKFEDGSNLALNISINMLGNVVYNNSFKGHELELLEKVTRELTKHLNYSIKTKIKPDEACMH